jgi:hypothetical protein
LDNKNTHKTSYKRYLMLICDAKFYEFYVREYFQLNAEILYYDAYFLLVDIYTVGMIIL